MCDIDHVHACVVDSGQIGSNQIHATSGIAEAYVREYVPSTCIHLWLLHTLLEKVVINVAVAGAHPIVQRAPKALVVTTIGFATSVYVCL